MSQEAKTISIVASIVVVVGVVGWLLMRQDIKNEPQVAANNAEALYRATPNARGKLDSNIVVTEFADMQCPACRAVNPELDKLVLEYGDKVKFVFRHYPLPQHKNAIAAANAIEAAGQQNSFFPMVGKVYEVQAVWEADSDPTPIFVELAKELNLNADQFTKDLNSQTNLARINQDKSDAQQLDVSGTPTFYVNDEQISQGGISAVKSKIDELIKSNSTPAPTPTPTPVP